MGHFHPTLQVTLQFAKINVDDESKWISINEVYPGFAAAETLANMRPHEKEGFLIRCCNWYKLAIRQMQKRIDLPRPILEAFVDSKAPSKARASYIRKYTEQECQTVEDNF